MYFFEKKCKIILQGIKNQLYLHSQNGLAPWSICFYNAEIAQLVEHNLAKVVVARSSLVFRSKTRNDNLRVVVFVLYLHG